MIGPRAWKPSPPLGKVASIWEQDTAADSMLLSGDASPWKGHRKGVSVCPAGTFPTAAHFGTVKLVVFAESWTAAVTKVPFRTAHPTKHSLLGFKMDGRLWVQGTGAQFPASHLISECLLYVFCAPASVRLGLRGPIPLCPHACPTGN